MQGKGRKDISLVGSIFILVRGVGGAGVRLGGKGFLVSRPNIYPG